MVTTELTTTAQSLGAQKMQNLALAVLNNFVKNPETTSDQRTILYEVFGSISELTI